MLPVNELTHVFYAFAKTDAQTGTVSLSDPWADIEKPMPLGGKGCLGELEIIRHKHRNLRVVLSIGGWTYSPDLTSAFATASGRQEFARTAVDLIDKHKLDGIDVDWEYPATSEQAQQYVDVLALIRRNLNELERNHGLETDYFDLTVAAPAGSEQREILDISAMNRYLTFWNLMTYDFSGAWSPVVAHHANLVGGDLNVKSAVDYYISHGVPRKNLVMGMPLYGRSFAHTAGLGHRFQGTLGGRYEQGVHDLRELPLPGAIEEIDHEQVAAYCRGQDYFVTYDNAETLRDKALFAKRENLGGGMWWEASGDRRGPQSAVAAFISVFGAPLGRLNWLGSSANLTAI